jgi:hypothetical protein
MAGVGYRYQWLELLAAYRHLDYKFDWRSPPETSRSAARRFRSA